MNEHLKLGTGEVEILARIAEDPHQVLELRPGGLWTTPSTGIFAGGQPRWWASEKALHRLRQLRLLRCRTTPRPPGATNFPELELTDEGRTAIALLREEGKIPCRA